MAGKKKKGRKVPEGKNGGRGGGNGLDLEDGHEEAEGVTAKDAGKGLIILGSMLIMIAMFMPFVLGTTDQKIWTLESEVFLFSGVGIVAIIIGIVMLNFHRLSRKL